MGRLQADLEEQEAAVEEAEGTAQQVRSDIALVQRTLNRTKEMVRAASAAPSLLAVGGKGVGADAVEAEPHVLAAMAENKRQTLVSLQGELEVLLPALALMQARVTEAKRRLEDRGRSVSSAGLFLDALRASCARSADRASTRATARASEQNSLDVALQALQQLSTPVLAAPASPTAATQPAPAASSEGSQEAEDITEEASATLDEVSFVQVRQQHGSLGAEGSADAQGADSAASGAGADDADEDASGDADGSEGDTDLLAMFSERDAASTADDDGQQPAQSDDNSAGDGSAVSSESGQAQSDPDVASASQLPSASKLKPEIKHLLEQLTVKRQTDQSQHEWCVQERSNSQLALRLAKASAGELAAEAEAHKASEAELNEEITRIHDTSAAIASAAKDLSDEVAREQAHLSSHAKDQTLANRILAQALKVLADLRASADYRTPADAARAADVLRTAAGALTSAKAVFDDQGRGAASMLQEVANATQGVSDSARDSLDALEREQGNLELARDLHASQRNACLDGQRLYNEQVQEAAAYAQRVGAECRRSGGATGAAPMERVRVAEVRALEDAEEALDGKLVSRHQAKPDAPRGLRGSAGAAQPASLVGDGRMLSPIERAAAEMGVPLDNN